MRADAQRNYDRIVEVAREVFREQGYDASLDEVAKRPASGRARSTGTSRSATTCSTRSCRPGSTG